MSSVVNNSYPQSTRAVVCRKCSEPMHYMGVHDGLDTWLCPDCNSSDYKRLMSKITYWKCCDKCNQAYDMKLWPACPNCMPPVAAPAKGSILLEAEQLINGPRREAYGPVEKSFERCAKVISEILNNKLKEQLDGRDVALIMCCMKLCREANAHGRDNLVDLAAYAALAQQVVDASGEAKA